MLFSCPAMMPVMLEYSMLEPPVVMMPDSSLGRKLFAMSRYRNCFIFLSSVFRALATRPSVPGSSCGISMSNLICGFRSLPVMSMRQSTCRRVVSAEAMPERRVEIEALVVYMPVTFRSESITSPLKRMLLPSRMVNWRVTTSRAENLNSPSVSV